MSDHSVQDMMTLKEALRECSTYQQPPLYNAALESWTPTNNPPKIDDTSPILTEGELIRVTDLEAASLAKKLADMHDAFLATATTTPSSPHSDTDTNTHSFTKATTEETLHIPKQAFSAFLDLYRRLSLNSADITTTTSSPAPETFTTPDKAEFNLPQAHYHLDQEHENDQHHKTEPQTQPQPQSVSSRQLCAIWNQGYDAGYAPGFEAGRRAAAPVAYAGFVSALEEVWRRVGEVLVRCEAREGRSGGGGGGGENRDGGGGGSGSGENVKALGMRGVVLEMRKLRRAVEFLVGKTRAAARRARMDFDELVHLAVGKTDGEQDYGEFLKMAVAMGVVGEGGRGKARGRVPEVKDQDTEMQACGDETMGEEDADAASQVDTGGTPGPIPHQVEAESTESSAVSASQQGDMDMDNWVDTNRFIGE